MAEPVVRSIQVEGFLSIRSARIDLAGLNVLIGANGSGKSNLVRAFEMLGRIADSDLAFFVGLNGRASTLLHDAAKRIRLSVVTSADRYEAGLVPNANDELIFDSESVGRNRLGGGRLETVLADRGGQAGERLRSLLSGCRVFHFHDTSRDASVKHYVQTADNLALHNDAANLAAVLLRLRDSQEDARAYRRIVGSVRQVAPFFRDFVLVPDRDEIRLRWRQTNSDAVFSANQMSDGTLRFVCLATLLLQPDLPALVVLDEPELGLHPYAIVQLAQLLRQAATRSQVLLATQSVTLMNQFGLEDLIVVERMDGASTFSRPDADKLSGWLTEYSLGELWEKNLIGGRPSGEGSASDA